MMHILSRDIVVLEQLFVRVTHAEHLLGGLFTSDAMDLSLLG